MNDRIRVLQHSKFGEIKFRKVPRSRSFKVIIKSDGSILVTLPLHANFTTAELFLYQNIEKIAEIQQKAKAKKEQKQTLFTPDTDFGTYSRKVQLIPEARKNVRVEITPDTVFIYYPENRFTNDEALQATIRKAVEHAWKVEAHEVLPQRLAELAAQFNLHYKTLLIKNARSYWGLCTADNTITLSIHLMHLPSHLIDFIILHELSHTIHKNHGANFWELLNQLTAGKARQYSREIQKYSTRIY